MAIGLIIIGSELLSGRRQDGHMAHAIELLDARGLNLAWSTYLEDDPQRITAALRSTMGSPDWVFCFGGIGATPDDHTRQAAADAAGLPLECHAEAAAVIEQRFGAKAHPQRIRMAHLPQGCRLIPNPVNQIAGFSLNHHHFLPGFPQMAWPMMNWVLEEHYADAFGQPAVERILRLPGITEGLLIGVMEDFVRRYPDLKLSCLPHMEEDYRETELGVRGPGEATEMALAWLREALETEGFPVEDVVVPVTGQRDPGLSE